MKQGWTAGIPPAAVQSAPENAFGELLELAFMTVAGEGGPKEANASEASPGKEEKDDKNQDLCNALAFLMEDPQTMGLAAEPLEIAAQALPKADGALEGQAAPRSAAPIVLIQGAGQAVKLPVKAQAPIVPGPAQEQAVKAPMEAPLKAPLKAPLEVPLEAMAGEQQAAPPEGSSADGLQAAKQDKAQSLPAAQVQTADKAVQAAQQGGAQEGLAKRSGEFQDHLEDARIKVFEGKPDDNKPRSDAVSPAAFALTHRPEQLHRTEGAQAAAQAQPTPPPAEESAARQVGKATLRAMGDGVSEYRLHLHPEGLGRVEVTLTAEHKTISLSMRTDNEAARALILDHAGELRAEMNSQDYQLGGLSVQVGAGSQGGAGFTASFGEQAGQGMAPSRLPNERGAQPAQAETVSQAAQRRYVPNSVINYRI